MSTENRERPQSINNYKSQGLKNRGQHLKGLLEG
jgi:hypothetical protein